MHQEVDRCRLCGNSDLVRILDLGDQALTGAFPRPEDSPVERGPLELVKCHGDEGDQACGLVQLRHTCDLASMYGDRYGYRSSLNASMVRHLHAKAARLQELAELDAGHVVLDIGSNDGTLLAGYSRPGIVRVGIDPSARRFAAGYPQDAILVPTFFSADSFRSAVGARRAKLVTSIAMFYDLKAPLEFAQQVVEILADDGVWHLEQSYLPTMIESLSYDTVCHEHLEYYALEQIDWIARRSGLRIVAVEFNRINGGSFAVTLARANDRRPRSPAADDADDALGILESERRTGLQDLAYYGRFAAATAAHRDALREAVADWNSRGVVAGYGASTKGNVLLQYCGFTSDDVAFIAEVNADKFGCVTPGTRIPIVAEAEAHARGPACFLVLPWHFRDAIVDRERDYLSSGGSLLFPLPRIEVVDRWTGR